MTIGMTNNKEEKQDKISYKAFSFRMDERTYKRLYEGRKTKNVSWNKYFMKLKSLEDEFDSKP